MQGPSEASGVQVRVGRLDRFALAMGWLLLACPGDADDGTASTGTTAAASTSADPTSPTSPTSPSTGHASETTGQATGTTAAASEGTTAAPGDTTVGSSSGGDTSTTGGDGGLGTIDGECGLIDAMELGSPDPFYFVNSIDFRDLGFDYDQLTPEGQQVYDAGNLGGSSIHSEVISFEMLTRCENASLLATEAEIVYLDPMGTKTDLLVEIDGLVVGVSVTRAVGFPQEDPWEPTQAEALLTGKLGDILESTANVAPRNAWVKQILHVIAYADMHADSLATAYATLPPELTADTILLVTVTHGNDLFVY